MAIQNILGRLLLGATLTYSGFALAQEADPEVLNEPEVVQEETVQTTGTPDVSLDEVLGEGVSEPSVKLEVSPEVGAKPAYKPAQKASVIKSYIRQVEIPTVSDLIDPNVRITPEGPVSVANAREMTPEEFGALFGPNPDGAKAKAVLTVGTNPILTEQELGEIVAGVKSAGQTIKPTYHLGTVGMEICLPGQKKCSPCIPGAKYELPTAGDDNIITFVCPDQKAAKKGVPACNTLYDNHGFCLDDTLAGAFGLSEKTTNGSCAGKNTACYNASTAKKFATDEDLVKVVAQMSELIKVVGVQNGRVESQGKDIAKLEADQDVLKGRVESQGGDIIALKEAKTGPVLSWGLYLGYVFNGANGGELGFLIGAPLVGDNGFLALDVRGYLLNNKSTNNYNVVLPTATQNTVDKEEVRRYMDLAVRFGWNFLGDHLNPYVGAGLGWQKYSTARTINLLGDTRKMQRAEDQFMGIGFFGADGKIAGPLNWYFRLEGDTNKKGSVSGGLEVRF